MSLSDSSPRQDPLPESLPQRGTVIGLALLLISIAVLPAFFHDLWSPDEPRVAHIAQSMTRSGDWVAQRVNGAAWVEQPPLHAWLVASSFTLFGSGFGRDWVARLPTMLFSLAMIVLVYGIGARYWGRREGLLAAVLLATTGGFYVGYQRAIVDASFAFFVTLAIAQLLEMAFLGEKPLPWRRVVVLGVSAGLSFLSNNLIGIAFIGLVLCATAACAPRCFFRRATVLRLIVALLAAVAVVAPWIIAFAVQDPDWHELLVGDTIRKFQRREIHDPTLLEFMLGAVVVLLPWLPLAILERARHARALVAQSAVSTPADSKSDVSKSDVSKSDVAAVGRTRVAMVVLWWVLLPTALVLASGPQRGISLLPVTPAVALSAAVWLARHLQRRAVSRIATGLIVTIAIALPLVALFGGIWANTVPWPVWFYLVATLAIVYRLVRHRHRHRHRRQPGDLAWVALSLLLCALGAVGLVFVTARNGRESYVRLCKDLSDLRREGFRLVGVSLPLRDVSAIPYYLDAPIEHQEPSDGLRELFQPDSPPVALVFRESIESEVLKGGVEYFVIGDYRVRRVLRVVANRPP